MSFSGRRLLPCLILATCVAAGMFAFKVLAMDVQEVPAGGCLRFDFENGGKLCSDGTATFLDGSQINSDGTGTDGNGNALPTLPTSLTADDGTQINGDGSISFPDGSQINSDGTYTLSDGTVINPDDYPNDYAGSGG